MHSVDEYGPDFEMGVKELGHDNEAHRTGRRPEGIVSHRPLDQDSREL